MLSRCFEIDKKALVLSLGGYTYLSTMKEGRRVASFQPLTDAEWQVIETLLTDQSRYVANIHCQSLSDSIITRLPTNLSCQAYVWGIDQRGGKISLLADEPPLRSHRIMNCLRKKSWCLIKKF